MSKSRKCWPEAPFDSNGNLHSYPMSWSTMQPVEPFEDTLVFTGFSRGRSSALMELYRKSDGRTVHMFLKDVEYAMPHFVNAQITGRFIYVKRGANYAIALETR